MKGLKRTSCSLVHIRKPARPKLPCALGDVCAWLAL